MRERLRQAPTPSCACCYTAVLRRRDAHPTQASRSGCRSSPVTEPVSSSTIIRTFGAPFLPRTGAGRAGLDSSASPTDHPGESAVRVILDDRHQDIPPVAEIMRGRRAAARLAQPCPAPSLAPPRRRRIHNQRGLTDARRGAAAGRFGFMPSVRSTSVWWLECRLRAAPRSEPTTNLGPASSDDLTATSPRPLSSTVFESAGRPVVMDRAVYRHDRHRLDARDLRQLQRRT